MAGSKALSAIRGMGQVKIVRTHLPLQVLPSSPNSSTVLLDQLLQRDTHLLLDDTRVVDVSTDAEELRALVPLPSKAGEPWASSSSDGGRDGDGLDVGNGRRASEKTDVGRERRFETGLALLALNRLDKGGLLTADVST
jgi:hypothetical protein